MDMLLRPAKLVLKKLQLDYLDLFLVHFPIATKHTGASPHSLRYYVFLYVNLDLSIWSLIFMLFGMFGWISKI